MFIVIIMSNVWNSKRNDLNELELIRMIYQRSVVWLGNSLTVTLANDIHIVIRKKYINSAWLGRLCSIRATWVKLRRDIGEKITFLTDITMKLNQLISLTHFPAQQIILCRAILS